MKENKIRENILRILIHNEDVAFVQLWDKDVPSNKFTYHLNKLIKDGYVKKNKLQRYSLTTKGKALEIFLDAKTGKKKQRPSVSVLLAVRKNNKFLLYHRTKEPFYGFYGFPVAKVDADEEIKSSAKKELLKETGLEGEGRVLSVINYKIKENNKLFIQCVLFLVFFNNPKGQLIEESSKGEYAFVNKTKFLQKNKEGVLFPDNLIAFEEIKEENNNLGFYEMSFNIVDSKFTDFKYKKVC